jgi:hypothetical protein
MIYYFKTSDFQITISVSQVPLIVEYNLIVCVVFVVLIGIVLVTHVLLGMKNSFITSLSKYILALTPSPPA